MLAHIGELQRAAETYVEYQHLFEQEPDDFSVVESVRAEAEGKHQVGEGPRASQKVDHMLCFDTTSSTCLKVLLHQMQSRMSSARAVLKQQLSGPSEGHRSKYLACSVIHPCMCCSRWLDSQVWMDWFKTEVKRCVGEAEGHT